MEACVSEVANYVGEGNGVVGECGDAVVWDAKGFT